MLSERCVGDLHVTIARSIFMIAYLLCFEYRNGSHGHSFPLCCVEHFWTIGVCTSV